MADIDDYYSRLRPNTYVEPCECGEIKGLLLVDLMTANPIHCINCKKEIDPENLKLSSKEVYEISCWYSEYQALYSLWLSSGEYESWAKSKLLDPKGEVNKMGLDAIKTLSKYYKTYYWWFHDVDDGDPENCPVCGNELNDKVKWGNGQCDYCCIRI